MLYKNMQTCPDKERCPLSSQCHASGMREFLCVQLRAQRKYRKTISEMRQKEGLPPLEEFEGSIP
jgi:hypothetical protein